MKSLLGKIYISSDIIFFSYCMLSAVYFNNNPSFKTNKINDKVVDWLLPPKLELSHLAEAKVFPKHSFGLS